MKKAVSVCLFLATAQCGAQSFEVQADWTMRLIVMISARMESGSGFGAGIVFAREKDRVYVATANHVVRRGVEQAGEIRVRLRAAPGLALPAQLLPQLDGGLDLAVLRVDGLAAAGIDTCAIPFDRLPFKEQIARGEDVYPAGNPNGQAWNLPVRPDVVAEAHNGEITFQSSVIAIGHSGGGLLNARGQLIGMIRADQPPFGVAVGIAGIVKALRQMQYPVHLRRQAPPGSLPLHGAILRGDLEEVKSLLDEPCIDANAVSVTTARLEALRDDPATNDMDLAMARHFNDYTPLMLAAEGKQTAIARLLVARGARLEDRSRRGTALHIAARQGATEIVKLLLASGVNANSVDSSRKTPLFDSLGHPDVLSLLLAAGADVNWKDADGGTSLMRAAASGNTPVIETLIQAGADPDAVNRRGESALAGAIPLADTNPAPATALLRYGKAVDPQAARRLLAAAAEHGWTELLQALLARGTSPDTELNDRSRNTPLLLAIDNAQPEVVKLLLQAGAGANRTVDGRTPLLHAIEVPTIRREGRSVSIGYTHDPAMSLQLARLLVEHRANVNLGAERNPEQTPLYVALTRADPPDFELAKLLIAHGANPLQRDLFVQAEILHRPEVIEFLRKFRNPQAAPRRR